MNLSFLATIAFSMLAIAMSFTANLVVLLFTASQWHVFGVILTVVAAASSYWAQHHFTASRYALHSMSTNPSLTALQYQSDRAETFGMVFQVVAIACLAASVVCFWAGMSQ